MSILLVDDQPANLLALEAILDGMGETLVKANSGEEALELADQEVAVILLDVQMAGLDGFETAKLIRGRRQTRQTPIIFLTAYDDSRLFLEQAYSLGAVDYLVKPLVPVILRAKVAGFIDLVNKTRELERRQTQQILAEARAYAENIVETVREPLVILSSDLRVKSANRSYYATFQVTPAETENQLFFELGAGQWDLPGLRKLLEQVVPLNAAFDDYEVEGVFQAIGRRVMRLNARRVYRAGNHSELILLALEDITERKRIEGALRESEQRLASLIDSSNDAIVSKSLEGIIQTWNAAAERLFGYTEEEAVGRHISFIIPPNRINEEEQIIARQRAGERVEHFDTVRMRKDGTPVDVSLTISPIRDSAGRIIGASKIARDVTDQKRLHAELHESERRKDEFLAMLGHELRNPLAGVVTGVQVLEMLNLGGDAGEMTGIIARQAAHMAHIVDDLLDVSRIARGKLALRLAPLDLVELVATAVCDYSSSQVISDCDISFEPPKFQAWVQGDGTRLAQVLTNLLHNACKFCDGPNAVKVSLEVPSGATSVELRVQDRGIGMTPETLQRIFEPFNQADTSLDRSRGGLGLGLALVKGVVELHGGRVRAESGGLGQGSAFTVTLPLLEFRLTESPAAAASAPSAVRKVLLIDDRQDAIWPVQRILELEGHQVIVASDGRQGLAKAVEFRPQVILCDIGLAGDMNGYQVAQLLRQSDHARAYLVAVTGYGQEEDRRMAQAAGFDYHLTKPVSRDQLREVMAKMPRF